MTSTTAARPRWRTSPIVYKAVHECEVHRYATATEKTYSDNRNNEVTDGRDTEDATVRARKDLQLGMGNHVDLVNGCPDDGRDLVNGGGNHRNIDLCASSSSNLGL